MKLLKLSLLLNFLSIIVFGQTPDTVSVKADTSQFRTTNAYLKLQKNYETFNNSFITGNSFATIRSQDNPKMLIDGIPINPILVKNTDYNEFLGHMHLLSYDIQSINFHTLQNDNKIVSGNYNNAISFNTSDIQLGKSAYHFEANNFTTLAYQDIDSKGYSTVFNFKAKKSYEKFGYRVSLNNGFQNDYIPNNGLQRYGGNLKLKYNPIKPLFITGFLDYTSFEDSKRSGERIQTSIESINGIDENNVQWNEFLINIGENKLTSNRLFTYINADFDIAEWLAIYGKYSYKKVSDSSERYIENKIDNHSNETYDEKRNYMVSSSYFDIGLRFKKLIEENTSINLAMGYNTNGLKYADETIKYYLYPQRSLSYLSNNWKPSETEKVLYSSLKLQNKHLTFSYLFNKTYFYLNDFTSFTENETNSFTNHLVSSNYEFIKNEDKKINSLVLGATYGKLANYSIIPQAFVINGSSPRPDFIVPFNNNNIELNLFSSFLRNRMNFSLTYYHKYYKGFNNVSWAIDFYGNRIDSDLLNFGKVIRSGVELNGDFHFIRNKSLDWMLNLSFSKNSSELERNKNLQLSDTLISNNIISIVNNLRYKNFQFYIELERKNGYDLNLYRNNITVANPFSYHESDQIIGIDNKGVPISQETADYGMRGHGYITDTDYFILRQIGLQYQMNNKARNKSYVIGLQYNKMRRLYLYVNDAKKYQEQYQKPSFYDAISLSFRMKF